MSELGLALRRLRTIAGLTVPGAALAAGVPRSRINRLENGKEALEYVDALRFIKAYSCTSCFKRYIERALAKDGIAVETKAEPKADREVRAGSIGDRDANPIDLDPGDDEEGSTNE